MDSILPEVVISLFRYFVISLFRYFVISLFRYNIMLSRHSPYCPLPPAYRLPPSMHSVLSTIALAKVEVVCRASLLIERSHLRTIVPSTLPFAGRHLKSPLYNLNFSYIYNLGRNNKRHLLVRNKDNYIANTVIVCYTKDLTK
jgi:hypothetical protein